MNFIVIGFSDDLFDISFSQIMRCAFNGWIRDSFNVWNNILNYFFTFSKTLFGFFFKGHHLSVMLEFIFSAFHISDFSFHFWALVFTFHFSSSPHPCFGRCSFIHLRNAYWMPFHARYCSTTALTVSLLLWWLILTREADHEQQIHDLNSDQLIPLRQMKQGTGTESDRESLQKGWSRKHLWDDDVQKSLDWEDIWVSQ